MAADTFQKVITEKAKRYGEQVLMRCARTGKTLTYRQLAEQVAATAEELLGHGLRQGSKVLLVMENSVEFALSFFGITQFGGIAVPVNTMLKEAELEYLIKDSEAAAVFLSEEFLKYIPKPYREKQIRLKNGRILLLISAETAKKDWPENEDSAYVQEPEDVAMMLYTSGTTGHPKGVILSYRNLLSKAEHIRKAHLLTERDTVLCVLPWFHINGLVITLITPLASDGKIVIGGKFSVTNFWDDVEKYHITWFSGVPTMYSHLLSRGIPEDKDKSSLRFARSASSPLPVAVLEEFERRCGVPIIESYGITEGASQITTNPMPPKTCKPGSVGLPFGNEIRIVDGQMQDLPAGALGEVLIKGDNITRGYYRKPEETEKSFSGEWFHSGDLGYLDGDGYLYLDGRIKELINRAGEKFSPREVDEVLYRLEGVELAATVGVPDEVYGEEVAAFIVRKNDSLTENMVKDWCQAHLAAYKVPRKVFFIEDLPKGGNGKIQRLKLIDIYKKGMV
ncbi:MAG: AMP-binding protein [Eubacteriales bacterium]|nr:AMP-binding protein [Eubacteriales bacterium]